MYYIGSGLLTKTAAGDLPEGLDVEKLKASRNSANLPAIYEPRTVPATIVENAGAEAGAGALAKTEKEVAKKLPWSLKKKLLVGGGIATGLGLGAYGLHRALS